MSTQEALVIIIVSLIVFLAYTLSVIVLVMKNGEAWSNV